MRRIEERTNRGKKEELETLDNEVTKHMNKKKKRKTRKEKTCREGRR
jgi:hypothetical protein